MKDGLEFDYSNMLKENIGECGIDFDKIKGNMGKYIECANRMNEKRDNMKWRSLPYEQDKVVEDIKKTAEYVRKNFDNFVVLGIGGSALGTIAVHTALSHLRYNELPREVRKAPKLFVEDNIDPERFASLFDVIDVKRTMFNVITKSGSTSETMSQFLFVSNLLKKELGDEFKNHIIVTTDEKKGTLIEIAKEEGLKTFFVPDGVGGRFSVLCPVGLLPVCVCGIDIEQLLKGAESIDIICSQKCNMSEDILKNPAYMMAVLDIEAYKNGANISVMMPYADSLKYFADWYAQLWAESLGKKFDNGMNVVNVGQTPVKSLGVTDQHSQVQLYTEGPFDKVITLIGVKEFRNVLEIPEGYSSYKGVSFLGGHTFNELIGCELDATEYALRKSGHMNKRITLEKINAYNIGKLICLLEIATAYAGELLNINAFDQPGVEEGKNATYALLGRVGYEEKRFELSKANTKNEKYVI